MTLVAGSLPGESLKDLGERPVRDAVAVGEAAADGDGGVRRDLVDQLACDAGTCRSRPDR